jgi:hypothetical protein
MVFVSDEAEHHLGTTTFHKLSRSIAEALARIV